jgi:hypothetical protein
MSLKNLELPSVVLAELYGISLVESKMKTPARTENKEPISHKIPVLGGNAANITIVVREETQPFMNDSELEWLQKMLDACKLTLGDVAIINLHPHKFIPQHWKKELSPKKVLLLGPIPSDLELPLNFPQFRIQEHDNCMYLAAPSARQLTEDSKEGRLLKSKLWVCLQKLFDV